MENKGFIFVLMPFSEKFNDVYHYGIKKTANDCGFYSERVDEQIFEGTILSRIYNQIQKADLIIADMTDRNPNVFYETGYAHALQKNVILLTQSTDDIPFDLKHYPHIIYNGNIKFLSEELTKKINWLAEQGEQKIDTSTYLEIYNDGKLIKDGSTIKAIWVEKEGRWGLDDDSEEEKKKKEDKIRENAELKINLDFFNNGLSEIKDINEMALVFDNVYTSERFNSEYSFDKITKLPNDKVLMKLDSLYSIYPQAWESKSINLGKKKLFLENPPNAVLRLFTNTGIRDIEFKFEFEFMRVIDEI